MSNYRVSLLCVFELTRRFDLDFAALPTNRQERTVKFVEKFAFFLSFGNKSAQRGTGASLQSKGFQDDLRKSVNRTF